MHIGSVILVETVIASTASYVQTNKHFSYCEPLAPTEVIPQLPQRSCKLEWKYKQVIFKLPGSQVSKGMTVSWPLTDEVHIFGDLMAARKKNDCIHFGLRISVNI